MALQLPRFDRSIKLVEDSGTPTLVFHQWWDRVAQSLEDAINNIVTILVRLGLVEVTADGALSLSQSAINPDGTIKTDKVLTSSIIANGVTQAAFVQTSVSIPLPDLTETDIISLSVSKEEDDSPIQLDCNLRISSTDDIVGTFKMYRDATLIDQADYTLRGATNTLKDLIPYSFVDEGIPSGTYTYKVSFSRNGGGVTVNATPGCSMRPTEFLR